MNTVFVTVPIVQVRVGEPFTPIEKRGEPIWDKRRRRWERKWAICPESYVYSGKCHGIAEDGRDGLFSLSDWAIVRRADSARGNGMRAKASHPSPGPEGGMSGLLRKYAR